MECNATSVRAGISTYTSAVSSTTSPATLGLLEAVEQTVSDLVREREAMNAFMITGQDLMETIDNCTNGNLIDPEDKLCAQLEDAENILRQQLVGYKNCVEAAKADQRLNDHHEESVLNEYALTLELIPELYEVTCELRLKVMEHDADLSPVTGSFTNTDDLLKHLHSL